MDVVASEGELAIAIIVVVIEVFAPIVPGEELHDADAAVSLFVFHKMRDQHWQFQ